MEILEIFQFAFMQRALVGGVLISLLTGLVGVYMVLQKASFYSDAVAHASLTGVAIGILLGIDPVISASVYAVMIALLLPWLRRHSRLPIDSILGFVLPFSMALGVILMSYAPGFRPELVSFLFGNVLSIGNGELALIAILTVLLLTILTINQNKFLMVAFDKVQAKVRGLNVNVIDTWFNVMMAVTIVVGVRLVGIVLINALLVIPASIVRLHARSLSQMFLLTPILSSLLTVLGIVVSVYTDWPTGPTIAFCGGLVFLGSMALSSLRRNL